MCERERDRENSPRSPVLSSRRLAVLYGTVHYFSTVYTAARSSLAYGLYSAVLLFDLELQILICISISLDFLN